MKKIIIFILLFFSVCLISCNSTKDLEQYVGKYVIEANYKRTFHYSWGNSKLLNESSLISRSFSLEIKDDGSFEVTYSDGQKENGKVSTSKEKIKFRGVDYLSKYEYKYVIDSSGVKLDYSNTETKIGFEYDYISERFCLIKKDEIVMKDEYAYECMTSEHTLTAHYPKYSTTYHIDKNYNKLKSAIFYINTKELTCRLENNDIIQRGTFEIVDRKYIFHFNDDNPLVPNDKEFVFSDYEEHYMYISLKCSEFEELEDYKLEKTYDISFYATR